MWKIKKLGCRLEYWRWEKDDGERGEGGGGGVSVSSRVRWVEIKDESKK